jgi:ABC-type transport system substrate-binding protein
MGIFKKISALCLGVFTALVLISPAVRAQPALNATKKVLRYALPAAEIGFDPIQVSDLYSRDITRHVFDGLLTYDYLARPYKLKPNVTDGLPVATNNFKTWTIKIRPGIYFADDPAFKGAKRELTAQDFAYSFKRAYDPVWKSPSLATLDNSKPLGMAELRKAAQQPGAKFDYDKPVEGIRALDRHTLQFNLGVSQPRFDSDLLVNNGSFSAVAREVVEMYRDTIMEHPVGTGPYRLTEWRRSSKIVLERNPNFREDIYEAEPAADDARAQLIYSQMKGKKLPLIDRVELAIIDEGQPRWLAFLGKEHDFLERLPNAFAAIAIPNNELAPHLKKRGIQMDRSNLLDVAYTYFNMDNPTIGGYTPDKVALRRAISLAYNSGMEIRGPRRSQAIYANGALAPGMYGYDANFKSELSDYSPARANALLDMYGYVDKNGDGWRDMPDGSPLLLLYASIPDSVYREYEEVWKKSMDDIHVKFVIKKAPFAEQYKAARAGSHMMMFLSWSAASSDAEELLDLLHGPKKGEKNFANFDMPEYNALFEKMTALPNSDERYALIQQAQKLAVTYMPYRFSAHRIGTDLMHPWMLGYKRHPLVRDFWRYVDIDVSKLSK